MGTLQLTTSLYQVCFACVEAGEFRMAQMCGLHMQQPASTPKPAPPVSKLARPSGLAAPRTLASPRSAPGNGTLKKSAMSKSSGECNRTRLPSGNRFTYCLLICLLFLSIYCCCSVVLPQCSIICTTCAICIRASSMCSAPGPLSRNPWAVYTTLSSLLLTFKVLLL